MAYIFNIRARVAVYSELNLQVNVCLKNIITKAWDLLKTIGIKYQHIVTPGTYIRWGLLDGDHTFSTCNLCENEILYDTHRHKQIGFGLRFNELSLDVY